MILVWAGVSLLQVAETAQADGPGPAAITRRLAEMQAEISDRSSPERTVGSFFRLLNNKDETNCLATLEWDRFRQSAASIIPEEVTSASTAMRNSFLTAFPRSTFVPRQQSYSQCMGERQSYSYEIMGVNPTGDAKTTVAVLTRNVTPLKPGVRLGSIEASARAEGTALRFQFVKQGSAWKVEQIYEQDINKEWSPAFSPASPSVPWMSFFLPGL